MTDHSLQEITADIPIIRPSTMTDMQNLRNAGLREATLNQVTWANRKNLVWIEYRNGMRRINIWTNKLLSRIRG